MLSLLWPHIRLNSISPLYGFLWINEALPSEWATADLSNTPGVVDQVFTPRMSEMYTRCLWFLSTLLIMEPVTSAFSMSPEHFFTQSSITRALSPFWCIMESNRVLQKQQLIDIRSMNSWPDLEEFKPQSGCFLNMSAYSFSFDAQLISVVCVSARWQ